MAVAAMVHRGEEVPVGKIDEDLAYKHQGDSAKLTP